VVVEAPTLAQAQPEDTTPFPWTLVILAGVAAGAYALHAAWAPRLVWGGQ
jgi:hypothetical protein